MSKYNHVGQGMALGHLKPGIEARIKDIVDLATQLVEAGNDKDKLRAVANKYEERGMARTARQIRIKYGL